MFKQIKIMDSESAAAIIQILLQNLFDVQN